LLADKRLNIVSCIPRIF